MGTETAFPPLDSRQAQRIGRVVAVGDVEPPCGVAHRAGHAAGVTVRLPYCVFGPSGIRPNVAFRPTSPVKPAGMRIEPPPSPPVAIGSRPPATTAAEPPDDPPGVRPCCHGLWVAPCSTVRVRLTPPNSLDVVCAARTAPPSSTDAVDLGGGDLADLIAKRHRCLVVRPASDLVQRLHTDRDARRTVCRCRRRAACAQRRLAIGEADGVQLAVVDRGEGSLELLQGERSPERNASTSPTASPCQVSLPMRGR